MKHVDVDRYIQLASEGYSQATTATIMGVSRERVRQIANKYGIFFLPGGVNYDVRADIAELHEKGLTDRQIADKLGISSASVRQYRIRLGLEPNKRRTQADCIKDWAEVGLTLTETAREMGVKPQSVWTVANRHGIKFKAKYRRAAE